MRRSMKWMARLSFGLILAGSSGITSVAHGQECEPVEIQKMVAGAPQDRFGFAVDFSGDTAIIGSIRDDTAGDDVGAAYIYRPNVNGEWIEIAVLTPNDPRDSDQFGRAVAIDGSTAIVGSQRYYYNSAGAAYIFRDFGNGDWRQVAKLSVGGWYTDFGCSVDISGNRVIIGALGDDEMGANAGAAYIYHENENNQWIRKTKLVPHINGAANDKFGAAVAISGDWTMVGAPGSDHNGQDAGRVYAFQYWFDGTWIQEGLVHDPMNGAGDLFGSSVDIQDRVAVVGARGADVNETPVGTASVFVLNVNDEWRSRDTLTASDGGLHDYFGAAVSISNQSILVGAYGHNRPYNESGAAYLFRNDGNLNWDEVAKLSPADAEGGGYFGCAVGISGDFAVVGAQQQGAENAGAAYIFELNCPQPPRLVIDSRCPEQVRIRVVDATPVSLVPIMYSLNRGESRIPYGQPCFGTLLGLDPPVKRVAVLRSDAEGNAEMVLSDLPPLACGRVHVQALDLSTCEPTNVVTIE